MKILFAIIGYFIGVFAVIIVFAMYSAATDSAMPNTIILNNIAGLILAIVGYNYPKKKN